MNRHDETTWVGRSERRLRQWLQASLANRIGFSLVSISLLFTSLVAAASFAYMAYLFHDKESEQMRDTLTLASERLTFTLNALADDIHTLAANPQVLSGVLDSRGQETYLQPLLRHFRPEGRTAKSLCLTNYKGETVGCGTPLAPNYSGEPWLEQVLGQNQARAVLTERHNKPILILAQPVVYEATGTAEGALVAEYDLAELMEKTASFLRPRFLLRLSGAGDKPLAWLGPPAQQGLLHQALRLSPVLEGLGLKLGIKAANTESLTPLGSLLAAYLVLGAALVFAAWEVSRRVAGALANRLESVTVQAEAVAKTGLLRYGLVQEGKDEIARLSRAFAAMTERVREINASLEQRVASRTDELAQANQLLERQQQELEATVQTRTAELAALNAHIDNVREEEKAAIARELHDEFGGVLTAIKMGVARLEEAAFGRESQVALRNLLTQADQAILVMRRILDTLRPSLLDHLGIGAAIHWQAQEFTRQTGIPCEVVLYDDEARLDEATSITLFRVMQESLTNVMRHADASQVTVSLSRDDGEITLEVLDDGVGIRQRNAGSHGLRGMEERARRLDGKLAIASEPGQGTRIELTLPG